MFFIRPIWVTRDADVGTYMVVLSDYGNSMAPIGEFRAQTQARQVMNFISFEIQAAVDAWREMPYKKSITIYNVVNTGAGFRVSREADGRGAAFVDFVDSADAERALDAVRTATFLLRQDNDRLGIYEERLPYYDQNIGLKYLSQPEFFNIQRATQVRAMFAVADELIRFLESHGAIDFAEWDTWISEYDSMREHAFYIKKKFAVTRKHYFEFWQKYQSTSDATTLQFLLASCLMALAWFTFRREHSFQQTNFALRAATLYQRMGYTQRVNGVAESQARISALAQSVIEGRR